MTDKKTLQQEYYTLNAENARLRQRVEELEQRESSAPIEEQSEPVAWAIMEDGEPLLICKHKMDLATIAVYELPDTWSADDIHEHAVPLYTAPPAVPDGYTVVPDDSRADEIVTRLFKRFRDWSERGFGPEDVTWCEVRADIVAMLTEAPQPDERCPECGYKDGHKEGCPEINNGNRE